MGKNICLACDSERTFQLSALPMYPKFALMKCKDCGLKFMLSENFENLGDDEYWDDVNKQIYAMPAVLAEFQKKHQKYLRLVKKARPPNNNSLDVGCGSGIFLNDAQALGFDAQGIEPSSVGVALCEQKYNISPIQGYLEAESVLPKNYGLVTAWDVIEHVANPKEFLDVCAAHLGKGGVLLLETPDESSIMRKFANFVSRLTGKDLRSKIYYPSHRFYFTHKAMKEILKSAGFGDIKIYKDHTMFSKSLEKYRLYDNMSNVQLMKYKIIFFFLKMPFAWNKQVVVCKKS